MLSGVRSVNLDMCDDKYPSLHYLECFHCFKNPVHSTYSSLPTPGNHLLSPELLLSYSYQVVGIIEYVPFAD